MKILHVYKDYYPVIGGIENHVRLVAEQQAAAGHDVTVLVTSRGAGTETLELNGVHVIKAARLAHVASTPLSVSLPYRLWRERPDVTHLHYPYPVGEVAQLAFGRSRHTLLSYHSDVVKQQAILKLYRPTMERVLRSVDRILVATPNYLATSETLAGFESKCEIMPYGIDRAPFVNADPDEAAALRAEYGPGPLLLFVGVLRYYKGLSYLLDAMPRVAPEARLLIAGDGPMGPELREQASALGLGERVGFLGRVPDEALPALYRAADLFVLPASQRSEAFGLVMVEAMSAGTPVICTELGTGTSFVNQHDTSGLVIAPRDPDALAAGINTVLSDEALRQRLAAGAVAHSAYFSVERMMADLDRVYAELA